MKQKTPMPIPTDLNSQQLRSDDLLTGEEMQSQPVIQQPSNDIPDLHQTEKIPNSNRREVINQQVDTTMNKMETIDERIQKDIQNAQKTKLENMPKDPKEILKSIIAQGEYKEDFRMFGQTWTLRALDEGDTLLALDEVRDTLTTQSGRLLAVMFGTIMYSIEAINGVSIYEWFEDIKLTDYRNDRMEYAVAVRRALRKYLEAMPPTIIDSLYDKYLEIDSRRNEGLEQLKNS